MGPGGFEHRQLALETGSDVRALGVGNAIEGHMSAMWVTDPGARLIASPAVVSGRRLSGDLYR